MRSLKDVMIAMDRASEGEYCEDVERFHAFLVSWISYLDFQAPEAEPVLWAKLGEELFRHLNVFEDEHDTLRLCSLPPRIAAAVKIFTEGTSKSFESN